VHQHDNQFSNKFDTQTAALVKQTSTILSLVAGTPGAIADLHALTIAQAEERERQTQSLFGGMKSVMSRIEILSLDISATSTAVHEYTNCIRQAADKTFTLMRNIQKLLLW
jgi:hypothetical protein